MLSVLVRRPWVFGLVLAAVFATMGLVILLDRGFHGTRLIIAVVSVPVAFGFGYLIAAIGRGA